MKVNTDEDITFGADLAIQFPIEALGDNVSNVINTKVNTSTADTVVGQQYTVADHTVLGVYGVSDGAGGSSEYYVKVEDIMLAFGQNDNVLSGSVSTIDSFNSASYNAVFWDYSIASESNKRCGTIRAT